MSDAEVAWFSRGRGVYIFSHTWDGFNRASERQTAYHPSQKPVALMRWCLQRARLAPGALVFDPYMGSGPVAQACKELGFRYVGCDLVEQYCDIAARRLSQEVMELV
jgi:DNA modification methylase